MPKYNLNNIPEDFKNHGNNSFVLLNLIKREPEEYRLKSETLLRKNIQRLFL